MLIQGYVQGGGWGRGNHFASPFLRFIAWMIPPSHPPSLSPSLSPSVIQLHTLPIPSQFSQSNWICGLIWVIREKEPFEEDGNMKQIMIISNLFLHTYVVVSIHILVTSVYSALLWGAVCVKIYYWQAFGKVWGFTKLVDIYINHSGIWCESQKTLILDATTVGIYKCGGYLRKSDRCKL